MSPIDPVPDTIQVMTTTDSREAAQSLAGILVQSRLAACVQVIGPVSSTYWWEGRVEEAEEWMCLAKTRSDRFVELEQCIRDHHAYDVPEVVALPVSHISAPYLQWLVETVPPGAS
jgi:periplasmic divalent cation tolerance protein